MNRNCFLGPVLVAALALSGCTGFETLTAATAPVEVFTLTPKSTFDPALPQIDHQIVVQEPTATAVVATDRIIVQPTPLRVQTLPGVRWVDRAPLIVQSLMIESFENSDRVPAVGRSQVGLRADYAVVPDLREFQARLPADAVPGADLEVHVRLNVKLVEAFDDRIIGSRSFEEIRPAASNDVDDVILAFDDALGTAMRDAVEWSVRTIAAHPGPRRLF